MVDEEVENILAEIRESVRARKLPASQRTAVPAENGDESLAVPSEKREAVESTGGEALARLDSYQAVTSRAWDRLPPIVSNRSGSVAGLELWVKRQIKRVTHWFTWEQINFNAAVDHALRDSLEILSSYAHELERLRTEVESQRVLTEQNHARLQASLQTGFQTIFEKQREEIQALLADFQMQRETLEAQLTGVETLRAAHMLTQKKEMDARLTELAQQMQERFAQLQDEQRVCFKQLSLEATEAAVLEDRARRKAETVLEELRGRMDQLKQ